MRSTNKLWFLSFAVLGFLCMGISWAGTDFLANTTTDMHTTLSGSGRKWLYIIEGISSLIMFRATKNVYVLGGVVVVAVFVNILLGLVA